MTEELEAAPVPGSLPGRIEGQVLRVLLRPTDTAALAAFRLVFGLVMATSLGRFLYYGWVDELFVTPRFRFKFWGFGWVEPLSSPWMHGLTWALLGLALCMAVGLFYRVTSALFVLGLVYLQLIDVTNYLNHYVLACLLAGLFALMPVGRAHSVDAWLHPRRAVTHFPAWCTWLLRFQVGIVYFYAGVAKMNADWLLHAQPLNIWLAARTQMPILGPLFGQTWAAYAMSWAGCLFDTSIAFFLLSGRTRPFAYAVVVIFHAATQALFPIGMFPTIMVTSALVFFSPSWPRRLLRLAPREDVQGASVGSAQPAPARRLALALGCLFVLFQAVFPLRHRLVYGGNVLWHEQGMRLSWKVMLREKNGSVTYRVVDRKSGRVREVNPRRWLTDRQLRDFATQPDMVLQLAHAISEDHRARGQDVAVYADALVSLNGRPAEYLVDPGADLSRIEDGLGPAWWIRPAPTSAPLRLQMVSWAQ